MSSPTSSTRLTLTVNEGRALLRSLIVSRTPSVDDRRFAPATGTLRSKRTSSDSEFKHTRWQVMYGNVMRRTPHQTPEPVPDTPDERILHTLRRKSYPTYPIQFENDHRNEPLCLPTSEPNTPARISWHQTMVAAASGSTNGITGTSVATPPTFVNRKRYSRARQFQMQVSEHRGSTNRTLSSYLE
ncbi:hypothetical protein C8R44DRAFT_725133 [Mycena epipterygia]|nr:hypothetical protein C8R44DRAFT_725133 [Mycena epipterygia]